MRRTGDSLGRNATTDKFHREQADAGSTGLFGAAALEEPKRQRGRRRERRGCGIGLGFGMLQPNPPHASLAQDLRRWRSQTSEPA